MKNRLCAKEIVSKEWLYNLHDEHAREMKIFGLSRPKLHSQATHQSLKAYYSLVKETGAAELKLEETLHGIGRATNKKNSITKELTELQNKQAKVDSEIQAFRSKIPKIKEVQKLHHTRASEIKKMKQSVDNLSASIGMLSSQKEQLENEVKENQNDLKIYSSKHLEFAKLFAAVEDFQSRFDDELSGFETYLNAIGVPPAAKQKLSELITEFKEKTSQIFTPTKATTTIKKSHSYNGINNTNPPHQQDNRIKPK
jgi:chromosome segregation ATPase